MKDKIKVGVTVFLEPHGNNARYGNKEIKEYTVKKVGRKYFTVWNGKSEYSEIQFYLDSLRQKTEYTPSWLLYFSKQEILDRKESNELMSEMRQLFTTWGNPILSLDQLRAIKQIIDQKQ